MAAPFTNSDVLRVEPSGATGVSVTPSGTAFNNSAWVQVVATTSTAWAIAGVYVIPPSINDIDAEIEVGIGASGSEVPIALFACKTGILGVTLIGRTDIFSPIMADRVPAGSRVSVRIRKGGTNTTAWKIKIAYYISPLAGSFNRTTSQIATRFPSGAASINIATPASSWTYTSYSAIIASLPFTAIILGAVIEVALNGALFEIDLATGTAGAEQRIANIWENSNNVSQGFHWTQFTVPCGPIVAGTRIAARARTSSASAASVRVSILALPFPY